MKLSYEQKQYLKGIGLILGIIFVVFSTVIGTNMGKESAIYERDMCNNLELDGQIDFDLDLEISGNTQKDCYEANNYKYFDIKHKLGGGLLACVLSILLVMLVIWIWAITLIWNFD